MLHDINLTFMSLEPMQNQLDRIWNELVSIEVGTKKHFIEGEHTVKVSIHIISENFVIILIS